LKHARNTTAGPKHIESSEFDRMSSSWQILKTRLRCASSRGEMSLLQCARSRKARAGAALSASEESIPSSKRPPSEKTRCDATKHSNPVKKQKNSRLKRRSRSRSQSRTFSVTVPDARFDSESSRRERRAERLTLAAAATVASLVGARDDAPCECDPTVKP
jgi:hypothetical protein